MALLFETFKARAEAVNAEVHRLSTPSRALDFVLEFLRVEGVADAPHSRAVWLEGSLLHGVDRESLARQVPGLTFDVTRENAESSKVGVTQADWAIAATGTLVIDATETGQRLASALPVIHVAVVPTAGIQPDMAAALSYLSPEQCAYISMITGPSRTADIERVLTIGVHGPSRLVIVFVDELGRN